jgi:hypothetical protein
MSKGHKKLTTEVSAMTFYNLRLLAAEAGYDTVGPVIDKLVRSHMVSRGPLKPYGGKANEQRKEL